MKSDRLRRLIPLVFLLGILALTGCGSDDDPVRATYRIQVTNITHGQPLSPLAVVFHGDDYRAWTIGDAADPALEQLAEGGDPTDFIQGAGDHADVVATATGTGVILPGTTDQVDLTVPAYLPFRLTLATMLVNTNDAFGGVNGKSIGSLAVGQSTVFLAPAYDAGTEANTESAQSVPGPAAGGEGYNALRDDTDRVTIHPGGISHQDGLTGSALDGAHRWDNPVLKVAITRTG